MLIFFSILFNLALFILVIIVYFLSRYHLGELKRFSFLYALVTTMALAYLAVLLGLSLPYFLPDGLSKVGQLIMMGATIGAMPIIPARIIQKFNQKPSN